MKLENFRRCDSSEVSRIPKNDIRRNMQRLFLQIKQPNIQINTNHLKILFKFSLYLMINSHFLTSKRNFWVCVTKPVEIKYIRKLKLTLDPRSFTCGHNDTRKCSTAGSPAYNARSPISPLSSPPDLVPCSPTKSCSLPAPAPG